ncbi:MAG: hypothetical protein Q8S35_02175, partial [bacterium]|nr:hypothetical protein [bacterium]
KLQVVGSASTPAIYAELAGVADNVILQTGITGGSGTFGWKLMQDELTTGDLYLKRRVSSVDSDVMYFQRATGNVGIGTTNPNSKLTVAGNIETTNGADRSLILRSSTNYNYTLQTTGDDFQILEAGDPAKVRLHIDYPNGNIGVGTTGPTTKLHVATNGVAQAQIQNTSGTTKNAQLLFTDNGGTGWRIGSDVSTNNNTDNFQIYKDSLAAAVLTINSSGNVGIGTTTPADKLDVFGGVLITGNDARLRLQRTTGPNYVDFNSSNQFRVRSIALNDTGDTYPFTIDTTGYVGINTTSPLARMHIIGGNNTSLTLDRTASPAAQRFRMFVGDGTGGTIADENYIVSANTGLHFWGGGSGTTEYVTFRDNGNVGIGNTNPIY